MDSHRIPSFILSAVLLASFLIAGCATVQPTEPAGPAEGEALDFPEVPREFRAAWIATVANIDWPSEPGLPVEEQQEELRALLDRAAALNLNAVVFQVRPAADALYDSPHEPWSEYLTGAMGRAPAPFYDPLAFAIEEAHRRGLELHAWFNPYRALHAAAQSAPSSDHISRTQPEIVREYGDYLWLDPGEPEAHAHTLEVIMDVVRRYDVDGVHFDDYFYPYGAYADGADFPDERSWQRAVQEGATLSRDDWRRQNVDRLMEELYAAIKAEKPHVKFGISPFGIWRPGHPERTTGFDAHAELYADARKWLREGWVDYFTPQLYYQMDQVGQPYPVMLRWWIEQNVHGRHIWPGNFTSRVGGEWPVQEITGQVYATRGQPGATGNVHFSMRALMQNPDSLYQHLAGGAYADPALPPASPWLGTEAPPRPRTALEVRGGRRTLLFAPSTENVPRWWVVRTRRAGEWAVDVLPGARRSYALAHHEAEVHPEVVAVSAVDRLGNEGPPAVERLEAATVPAEGVEAKRPEVVSHEDWQAQSRLGYAADAARRNLAPGDTLRFQELRVVLFGLRPAAEEAAPDSARLLLQRGPVRERWTVAEGSAFNWHGYHVGLLAANTDPDALGRGLAELEVATTASLPIGRAAARQTGDAAQRLRAPHRIERITLHHSGSPEPLTPDEDPVERLQGLQTWGAAARNWWDVPYHFLVDLDGRVYEGRDARFSGETNTAYDPRGHLLISVLGNYNEQEPTEAQLAAIADLMAWAVARHDIPLDHIHGHDDWAATSCPGEHLRPYLEDGTFQEAVKERLER